MSKRLAKVLAVVSTTTAVGVMPLLGANLSETVYYEQVTGKGITDVLYNESIIADNVTIIKDSDITVVASEEEIENPVEEEVVEEEKDTANTVDINGQNGFKSYMSYGAISNHNSDQYKLQVLAYTGEYGLRVVDDRYCIAVGTALNASVGTYVDLVLENGITIPCVVGDIKADQHTLSDNITTASNGCVSEFIVDGSNLSSIIKQAGNVSVINESWNSAVTEFVIYDYNILDIE